MIGMGMGRIGKRNMFDSSISKGIEVSNDSYLQIKKTLNVPSAPDQGSACVLWGLRICHLSCGLGGCQ